jgi:hypothetical protein
MKRRQFLEKLSTKIPWASAEVALLKHEANWLTVFTLTAGTANESNNVLQLRAEFQHRHLSTGALS